MNLTTYTLVKTHASVTGGVNNHNVVLILNKSLQGIKTFCSKLSLKKCQERAQSFLRRENERLLSEKLSAPLGKMFICSISGTPVFIERIEENTYNLFDSDFHFTTIDGDLLINIINGKQKLSTLNFE